MSTWTHVNSAIRFDSLRMIQKKPDLGISVSFEDSGDAWDRCNIPCGSEGSLTIDMWESPDESSMAAYNASIFGDLRDYDDDDEIISYFNRITEGQMVRAGFFSIDIRESHRYFVYEDDNGFKEVFKPQ